MKRLLPLSLLLVAVGARAELPANPFDTLPAEHQLEPDECAATFPDRLADAKKALAEQGRAAVEYEKSGVRAKVEWFNAHCRFLTEIEIVVRKLDDLNSFVCDKNAKGRPKGITAELIMEYSEPASVSAYQSDSYRHLNGRCHERDQAERIGLHGLDELTPLQQLELLCYGDARERCTKARATIAAARAKGHR